MALNGIKSMSMLTTAPVWRQSIETIVSKYDDKVILEAWKREFERSWQLFFIHNKVTTIETQKNSLAKIFPWKKIVIAHGQLPWDQLEKRILAFKKKEYDILLATTVIENWIDFSNVNTIFINDAYNFWISQIHQLRWRVWRSDKQWYCYLLFNRDKIKDDAAKRLKTIVDYSHLWAWFELAIKDLEIRWWWDILGIKQSGQQAEIGINLYLEMLENKIEEIKKTGPENMKNLYWENKELTSTRKINTSIDLQLSAFIDNNLFHWELDKINFYREIESLEDLEDLENIISDFKEINTDISKETQNFFDLLEIKLKAPDYKITSIRKLWINYQIDFVENINLDELKWFLKLDHEVKFEVNKLHRLRASVKKFTSEQEFLNYIKGIFSWKKSYEKKKIKLKKKA
jgi:transcription-repair coupling factor (superfamily II helicase)